MTLLVEQHQRGGRRSTSDEFRVMLVSSIDQSRADMRRIFVELTPRRRRNTSSRKPTQFVLLLTTVNHQLNCAG